MADISVTATTVARTDGTTVDYNAAETITAGQTVYLSTTTGTLYKADNNDTAAKAVVLGVALNGGAAGQPIKVQTGGNMNPGGAILTVGTIYVQSATAGGICPNADLVSNAYVTIIGVGTTTSNMKLHILASGIQVP